MLLLNTTSTLVVFPFQSESKSEEGSGSILNQIGFVVGFIILMAVIVYLFRGRLHQYGDMLVEVIRKRRRRRLRGAMDWDQQGIELGIRPGTSTQTGFTTVPLTPATTQARPLPTPPCFEESPMDSIENMMGTQSPTFKRTESEDDGSLRVHASSDDPELRDWPGLPEALEDFPRISEVAFLNLDSDDEPIYIDVAPARDQDCSEATISAYSTCQWNRRTGEYLSCEPDYVQVGTFPTQYAGQEPTYGRAME